MLGQQVQKPLSGIRPTPEGMATDRSLPKARDRWAKNHSHLHSMCWTPRLWLRIDELVVLLEVFHLLLRGVYGRAKLRFPKRPPGALAK